MHISFFHLLFVYRSAYSSSLKNCLWIFILWNSRFVRISRCLLSKDMQHTKSIITSSINMRCRNVLGLQFFNLLRFLFRSSTINRIHQQRCRQRWLQCAHFFAAAAAVAALYFIRNYALFIPKLYWINDFIFSYDFCNANGQRLVYTNQNQRQNDSMWYYSHNPQMLFMYNSTVTRSGYINAALFYKYTSCVSKYPFSNI